jgi:amino acid adenylation domain-containing protein
LSEQLKALSRRENVTLFMTLLSAFQLLLSRYSGQKEILVGIPVAGRTSPESEGLIGCFMNMLVTRTKLTGDPSFRELLSKVRETALQAFMHQDIPFEKLVEELRPERDVNRWPLFQVMFNFRNLPKRQPPQPGGLCLEVFPLERGTIGGLDLSLEIKESVAGLHCTFNYAQELFRADTIERMGGVFRTLLEAVAADVELPLSSYPLLTGEERRQVLIEWNQTRTEYPGDCCLHHLFEAQAQRTPESVAVVFESEQITYQQLNERANQLAHYLRKRGVAPETLVGICMERSLDLVVGLLGILKAGGAYLPLDPEYPKDRLAYMLNDARTTIVITHKQQVANLPPTLAWLVCLDTDLGDSSLEENQRPDSAVTAGNLAYVIYTSGSTGRPKGVMISHGSVCNYLHWRREYFPLKETDKLLQKASLSFDDSVWEIFEPLMVGATLVMARPGGHQDSAYLVELIANQKITAACFVPSLLQAFLEEPGVAGCKSLRRVTTGGEALSVELQECFSERLSADLYNGYGPTEATIGATFWTCRRNLLQHSVPIGRPISNTEIYLLDSHLNPVPVGVLGELCIAGAGLARGYLKSPELTAERFISNPFSQTPGGRLYRTGDLARYLPDGNIEFLGRLDSQVKIRGVRVEPGEVEAVVRQHPSINTAIVLVHDDQNRAKRLVAYLLVRPERSLDIRELRRFLMERLPGYMIPTAFVFLDALPLAPSGKIDRQSLPVPDWGGLELHRDFAAPSGPFEEKLTEIWAEVLGLKRVGVRDNFFELGGHSLLATRLMSRVYATFGVDLTLRSLFEKPTIEGLALVIAQRLTERTTKNDLNAALESLERLSDEEAHRLTGLKG